MEALTLIMHSADMLQLRVMVPAWADTIFLDTWGTLDMRVMLQVILALQVTLPLTSPTLLLMRVVVAEASLLG